MTIGNTELDARNYPQVTFSETKVATDSFYGRLQSLYADVVLKTQLEQLRKQGSYDAFKLKWHPVYDVRRLQGAKSRTDWALPPSLFWESDVAKWIESVAYFLQSRGTDSNAAREFGACVEELIDMIAGAQQPDGYLNIYFTVVDPQGRFQNLRDMHEMYNAGHLIEASLAWFNYCGDRRLLDVMIKNVELFMDTFGTGAGQIRGYCGHPEMELAMFRLHDVTQDVRHKAFAEYLLSERGQRRQDLGDRTFFEFESEQRRDPWSPLASDWYYHSAQPITSTSEIGGHSVRAFYLWTAAADAGGPFLDAAKRVWENAIERKMYVTGGFGSEPANEAFSKYSYRLPQSSAEGGCYTETCASIAAMMFGERLLHHKLDGGVRDVVELAFLNAVLGGGSLDGKSFAYSNKLATCCDEVSTRKEWFEVCCCPPNLSRTLGMLGGYTWSSKIDQESKTIHLSVYLFVSATRTIDLGDGSTATASLKTGMPWVGSTALELAAPAGWSWQVDLPCPEYASNVKLSGADSPSNIPGYLSATTDADSKLDLSFDLPVRILASHPATGNDTLTVTRGPIVFVAESVGNEALNERFPHFEGLGLSPSAKFTESSLDIHGVSVLELTSSDFASLDQYGHRALYRPVNADRPVRSWTKLNAEVKLVPWFARANRGGKGHVRTSFLRAE